jgi:hypothetical protein
MMKIAYTLPSISVPHGGYRIHLEHLTRLQRRGYDVTLYIESGSVLYDWFPDQEVTVARSPHVVKLADIVVLGSPHTTYKARAGQKLFTFAQMAEHLFRPDDMKWRDKCEKWYNLPCAKLYGANHVGEYLHGSLHYIEDGVNTKHYPVESPVKPDRLTVLVEGWECSNPAKDTLYIAPRIAMDMKKRYDCEVLAYGFLPHSFGHPDEYHYRPSLDTMNDLYRRSHILLKATRYDSRALSPTEAATKKCATVRAITEGDDNLVHGLNCLRTEYDYEAMKEQAFNLAENSELRDKLTTSFIIPEWEPIIDKLEKILIYG